MWDIVVGTMCPLVLLCWRMARGSHGIFGLVTSWGTGQLVERFEAYRYSIGISWGWSAWDFYFSFSLVWSYRGVTTTNFPLPGVGSGFSPRFMTCTSFMAYCWLLPWFLK